MYVIHHFDISFGSVRLYFLSLLLIIFEFSNCKSLDFTEIKGLIMRTIIVVQKGLERVTASRVTVGQ